MCAFFKGYALPVLVTSNGFCFKCMLCHLPFWNNGYNNKGCIAGVKNLEEQTP